MEKRLQEIALRKSEIATEIAEADEARFAELKAEVDGLEAEERGLLEKKELLGKVNVTVKEDKPMESNTIEARAQQFAKEERETIEARALLVSGGTIATPTGAQNDINEAVGAKYSSIVDMVDTEIVTGMGAYVVPLMTGDVEGKDGTEGTAPAASDATFAKVTLTPNEYVSLSYVSKLLRKEAPQNYEAAVSKSAKGGLRQKMSKAIVDAVYASAHAASVEIAKDTTNGAKIGADTLRKIVLNYGGDEAVEGQAVLFLNKTDLQAFGDVRGTNEKKAVYDIVPDSANPNVGLIKDGGLSVPYCINKNCEALAGNKGASKKTMIYGNPKCVKQILWGDVEVEANEGYKFAEGLLTVRGEVLADADLVVKDGFVVVKISA